MDPLQATLDGILLPAVIAGLVLVVGWRPWRRDRLTPGSAAGSLSIGLAFLAAFLAVVGTPASPLPGSDRTPSGLDWLFWSTAILGIVFSFEGRCPRRWIPALRGFAAVILIEAVLRNTFRRDWAGMAGVPWLLLLVAILLLPWWAAERHARRRSGASTPLILWATAASLAAVAGLSGSAKLAQLTGAVAAALGAAVVLAWWRPTLSLSGGAVSMTVLVLFGLALNAHFYSYTTMPDVLLLAAGPLMPLLMAAPGLRRLEGAKATAATLGLTLLPLSIALLRAVLAYEPDPYAGY